MPNDHKNKCSFWFQIGAVKYSRPFITAILDCEITFLKPLQLHAWNVFIIMKKKYNSSKYNLTKLFSKIICSFVCDHVIHRCSVPVAESSLRHYVHRSFQLAPVTASRHGEKYWRTDVSQTAIVLRGIRNNAHFRHVLAKN